MPEKKEQIIRLLFPLPLPLYQCLVRHVGVRAMQIRNKTAAYRKNEFLDLMNRKDSKAFKQAMREAMIEAVIDWLEKKEAEHEKNLQSGPVLTDYDRGDC